MDLGISGKQAVVLGASRGLGAAIAGALADEGVAVLAVSRSGAAPAASGAAAGGGTITARALDLSDLDAVDAFAAELRERGDIDILVNNSGGPKPGPARDQQRSAWTGSFTDMACPFFTITDAALEGMTARGWGRIITVGSSGIVQPIPNLALSNAIRSAIAGWSKTLAAEVAARGVTVNMLLPGRIDTDRLRELDEAAAERTGTSVDEVARTSRARIPVGRYGTPEEFGAAAAFLSSRQAAYITGSKICVDGGLIAGQ